MRIKIFFKKLISICVAAFCAATLVGCFDLGDFEDEAEYYASFGDVRLVYQNPKSVEKDVEYKDYSIKDYFYNKNTGEDFAYGDPKDEEPDKDKDIPQLPYVYMAIPVKKDLSIESVALYFNALQMCSLKVEVYVVNALPDDGDFTNIRLLGDPEYRQKFDGNGKPVLDENKQPIYELLEYSDPEDSLLVVKDSPLPSVYVKSKEWCSLVVDNWKNGKVVEVKQSQYLLLRFINNSGAGTEENPTVAFRLTNLLIRAFF